MPRGRTCSVRCRSLAMIVSIVCVTTNEGMKLDAILGEAVRFLSIPLMVVAVAAVFTALRGGDFCIYRIP